MYLCMYHFRSILNYFNYLLNPDILIFHFHLNEKNLCELLAIIFIYKSFENI